MRPSSAACWSRPRWRCSVSAAGISRAGGPGCSRPEASWPPGRAGPQRYAWPVNQPGPGWAGADQPAGPDPAPGPDSARRRPLVVALVALAGLGCLALALLAGRAALAEQTRRPTAAERTAAAATAVARRW